MSDMRKTSSLSGACLSESLDTVLVELCSLISAGRISSARQLAKEAIRRRPQSEKLRRFEKALYPGAVTRHKLPDSVHSRDMEWLACHQEEHRGEWVALLDGQLVAAGKDLNVLLATLGQLSVHRRPLIHHIRD